MKKWESGRRCLCHSIMQSWGFCWISYIIYGGLITNQTKKSKVAEMGLFYFFPSWLTKLVKVVADEHDLWKSTFVYTDLIYIGKKYSLCFLLLLLKLPPDHSYFKEYGSYFYGWNWKWSNFRNLQTRCTLHHKIVYLMLTFRQVLFVGCGGQQVPKNLESFRRYTMISQCCDLFLD